MKQSWYSDNSYRDYPFVHRSEPLRGTEDSLSAPSASSDSLLSYSLGLPQQLIVDFGAIMGVSSGYLDASTDYVYLHAIHRHHDTLLFRFRTTSPGVREDECVFSRTMSDAAYAIEWVDAVPISGYSGDEGICPATPTWRGFLVTGQLSDLFGALSPGAEFVFPRGFWRIEPTRVQTLADTYVRSISLANFPRAHTTPAPGCPGESDYPDTPVVAATCIQGPISFVAGYNLAIRQENQNNAFIFSASAGSGDGQPCGEIPLPGESLGSESPFFSGGPGCGNILKTINGVGAKNLVLTPGQGIAIYPDPDNAYTLIIDRTLNDMAACLPSDSSLSLGA